MYGSAGLHSAYNTGRGVVQVRGRATVEEAKRGERIVITEIPYQVNKTTMIEKIADMVRDKRLEGVSDIRDESDRDGMRVVVELKRDANGEVVLNHLYANTQLQTSFGFNMLAIVAGGPQGAAAARYFGLLHRASPRCGDPPLTLRAARGAQAL